jgi:hypothetical protein
MSSVRKANKTGIFSGAGRDYSGAKAIHFVEIFHDFVAEETRVHPT